MTFILLSSSELVFSICLQIKNTFSIKFSLYNISLLCLSKNNNQLNLVCQLNFHLILWSSRQENDNYLVSLIFNDYYTKM